MAIDLIALKNEINNDPKALGYSGKSDYDVSVLLNTPGLSNEKVFRAYTDMADIIAAIVRSEYDALSASDKAYLNAVILAPGGRIKSGDATLRAQVGAIFGAGTASRTNLTNASQKTASRAEALFGENTSVNDGDVARARAS